ncbi:hypothetical protein B0O99DRAFT_654662 [Bisporella sp. PMI_857]|nr:hypothetical protein B0O99DRAFT_654662 [Bisporella sp. PMI_857]
MSGQPHQLLWNLDNVRDVAESVGISQLNPEAIRSLGQEVEYRVGQIITEAMRFMHMGKRTVLGTQDIAQALKVLDVEPLYGYESTRPLRFGEASLGPGQPLFYVEDEEVDFEKLINAPLPKVPRDMSFTAHWLAVDGVQPPIPQNPTTAEARSTELVAKGPGANQHLGALAGNDVNAKPLVKHVLSKELIMYFDRVIAALINEDTDEETTTLRTAALASVREEPIHQLVPYFDQYVSHKVTHCLDNTFILTQMMNLVSALIENKTLFLDPYIPSLIPPILTCLTSRKLGSDIPTGIQEQYELRDLSASLMGAISQKYKNSGHQAQVRLLRSLSKSFFDYDASLAQHYGALMGIFKVGGPDAIRMILLPMLKGWSRVITKGQPVQEDNVEQRMIIAALVRVIESMQTSSEEKLLNGEDQDVDKSQLEDALGPIIGERIAGKGNQTLNKIIFRALKNEKIA